jgi:hypothetical protein
MDTVEMNINRRYLVIASGAMIATPGLAAKKTEDYYVNIYYLSFYDKEVRLFIDGVKVFDGRINVIDASVGLSAVQRVCIPRKTKIRISFDVIQETYDIVVNHGGSIIVNASAAPYVKSYEGSAPLLD